MKHLILFITAIIFIFPSSRLRAEPTVSIETQYYTVSGNSLNEIRKDINTKTPIIQDGKKYDARTKWSVKWNFWRNESHGNCKITKVATNVDVKFIFPKLNSNLSLPNSVIVRWDTYKAALTKHENGHKNIGISAAREIENRILNMGTRYNCKVLETKANDIGNTIITKYQQIEVDYDETTNHGIRNGAIFP